jgi:hypothetical protein
MHTRIVTFLFRLILACGILLALPGQALAAGMSISGPATISEAAGKATYTVNCGTASTLPGVLPEVPNTGALSFAAASGPAPAATAADFGAPSQTLLTCSIATTSFTVDVPITNDTLDEQNKKFTVTVGGALAPEGSVSKSVTTTIADDDPIASIAPVAFILEGDSGTSTVDLNVTLSSPAALVTTIAFSTDDLTATAGPDYMSTTGNVVFQPGEQSKTVSVPVVGDTVPEGTEGFFVNLTSTDNGSLQTTGKQGGVGIVDNDKAGLPTVSLPKSVSVEEGTGGTTNILFNVNLSSAATQRTEVKWKTSNFTADGADYQAASGTLVFQKGQKTKTISVDVKGDKRDEPEEAFALTLSNPVGAALGQKGSFGVIQDDDGPKVKIGKPRVRGKNLVTKVRCPKSASRCRGELAGKAGKVKLGHDEFDLVAGGSQKLKLRLSKKARNKLADHALKAKLIATAADANGDTLVTKRKARLKRKR